jgi:hypothetical protein
VRFVEQPAGWASYQVPGANPPPYHRWVPGHFVKIDGDGGTTGNLVHSKEFRVADGKLMGEPKALEEELVRRVLRLHPVTPK